MSFQLGGDSHLKDNSFEEDESPKRDESLNSTSLPQTFTHLSEYLEIAETSSHLSEHHLSEHYLSELQQLKLPPEIIQFLERLHAKPIGHTEETFSFEIQPGGYSACLKALEKDNRSVWGFINDKLKAELIDDKLLIIKMAKALHECILIDVLYSLLTQCDNLYKMSNDSTKELVGNIKSFGTAMVQFKEGYSCPDTQFRVRGFAYPGVVFEVSHSETIRKLSEKVERYFDRSNGEIQVVIGLKFGYRTVVDELYVHVWRRGLKVMEEKVFEGETAYPGSITFKLQDFAPAHKLKQLYPNASLDKELILDFKDLAGYYRSFKEYNVLNSDEEKCKGEDK